MPPGTAPSGLGKTGRCRGPLESRSRRCYDPYCLGVRQLLHCWRRVRTVDHPKPIVRGNTFPSPDYLRGVCRLFLIAADNPAYRAGLNERATLQEHLFLCGACGACGAVRAKRLQLHWLGRATFRGAEIVAVGHVGQANVAVPHMPHMAFFMWGTLRSAKCC